MYITVFQIYHYVLYISLYIHALLFKKKNMQIEHYACARNVNEVKVCEWR